MWRNLNLVFFLCWVAATSAQAQAQTKYEGLGRLATPAEIKAWDIDVRADFKGLPAGSGSAVKGGEVWDAKCASCHGVFGESNQVFPPLAGGTTPADMQKGRVAGMTNGESPYRTTLMKVSQISTLWDYINRAMPWNAPKSLSVEEVYSVTAYLLNLGGIVGDDFVLSNHNMAAVQAALPNRNGKTMQHGLWHVNGKPDVKAAACMHHCGGGTVSSALPDYARNAHGNLAEQNRTFGPYRGVNTLQAPSTQPIAATLTPATAPLQTSPKTAQAGAAAKPALHDALPLLNQFACTACHAVTGKRVGPSFADISQKYAGKNDAANYLTSKIKNGSQGVWGAIPMPAQSLPAADAAAIAQWLLAPPK